MSVLFLDHRTMPDIARQVARAAFPNYNGQKFKMVVEPKVEPNTYWDGGSRTLWKFVRLADMAVLPVPGINPLLSERVPALDIPEGVVAVSHYTMRGKDMGITFHVREPGLLPAPSNDATEDERIVCTFTASLKSSYNGISNYRFHEARRVHGITAERWEAAKQSCIAKGWLNKAGAITPEGRNIREQSKIRMY